MAGMISSQRAGRGTSRPRVSNACQECKRRKLRCDLARPTCSRCVANRVACVYDSGNPLSQTRFQFVEEPTLQEGQQQIPAPDSSSDNLRRVQVLEREIELLNEQIQQLRSGLTSLRSSPGEYMPETKRRRRSVRSPDDSDDSAGDIVTNTLGKTIYMSNTHWASPVEEKEMIKKLLTRQERYEVSLAVPDGAASTKLAFGGSILAPPPSGNPAAITSSKFPSQIPHLPLPNRAACDALVSACMYSIYPLVGVFDAEAFEDSYRRFWQDSEQDQDLINMPLLTAILFSGSNVCAKEVLQTCFPGKSRQRVNAELYLVACKALKWSCFPRAATIETLGAYLLLQPMWFREEEPLRVLSCVGLVVRVAQILGLNKDPASFGIFSEAQALFRRRMWWQVFVVDVLVALASGLPPMIDRDSFDVKPLTLADTVRSQAVGSIAMDSGYFYLKYAMRSLERSLLDRTLDAPLITENHVAEMVDELEAFTQATIQVASVVQPDTDNSSYGNNPTFNCWVRYTADMVQHKDWWFLYKPALRLLRRFQEANDTEKIQQYEDLLARVREHCRLYLDRFIGVVCNELFHGFHWCWPGIMQPLHHMIVLFREVDRIQKSTPPAATLNTEISTIRQTIDEALALSEAHGGLIPFTKGELMYRPLTEGGQEAWELIRDIHERLWRNIGLDPDILPTRQEVAENAMERYRLFEPEAPQIPARQETADTGMSVEDRRLGLVGDLELSAWLGEFRGLDVPTLDVDELDALFES